ncbi:MAG: ABC transporter permease subunit [Acidimicrobiia bacterium]
MGLEVFHRTVADRRRSLLGWGLGLVALVTLSVAVFPAVRDRPELNDLLKDSPEFVFQLFGLEAGAEFFAPESYLSSRLFAGVLPLMLLIFLIGFGVNTIAGEERDGTLDLLLANPIARSRVVLEKFWAMVVSSTLLAVVTTVTLLIGVVAVDMDVSLAALVGAVAQMLLLALMFGALALAAGCATGRRGLSIGLSSGIAVGSFVVYGLAPLAEALEPAEKISPFFYYLGSNPVQNGLHLGHAAVMLAATAVLLGASLVTFRRRDVGV